MSEDPAVRNAALALMAQYGDDAEVIAVLKAAELAAAGDLAGLNHWDAVIAEIGRLENPGSGSKALN
jgi:hypothetical protein